MARKPQLHELQKDNAARVKKVRALTLAKCNILGRVNQGFEEREAAYIASHPRLAEQMHCGFLDDSNRPTKKIIMPNGVTFFSAWYKVPTCDKDSMLAFKEQEYLRGVARALERVA